VGAGEGETCFGGVLGAIARCQCSVLEGDQQLFGELPVAF